MPRALSSFVVLTSLLLGVRAESKEKVLPVPMHAQEGNVWCWAASGQMIFSYLGATKLSQCEEANHEFGRNDCCGSVACSSDNDCIPASAKKSCQSSADCATPGELCRSNKCTPSVCAKVCIPAACNQGGHTEFTPWDFESTGTGCSNLLSFKQLQVEIDANRPVEFAWSGACSDPKSPSCWSLCGNKVSGGHVLVATGYKDDPALGQMVFINDPWPPNKGAQYWLSYNEWIGKSTPMGGSAHFVQGHSYQIKDVPFCHSDNFGFPGNFQHCFDYHALRGKSPVAISFMNAGGTTTVASSFQHVPARPTRHGMTYPEWDAAFASNKKAGYRPESVSVMVDGAATPRVTAIWTPTEGDFHSFCAMTADNLKQNDKTYRAQGYAMTDFFGYTAGPAKVAAFCATWVKKPGKYDFDVDKTAAEYNEIYSTKSKAMVPMRMSGYDTPTGRRYAILWLPPTSSWYQWFDMSPTFYQAQHDALYGKGYVQRSITSLDGRYSALWEKQ